MLTTFLIAVIVYLLHRNAMLRSQMAAMPDYISKSQAHVATLENLVNCQDRLIKELTWDDWPPESGTPQDVPESKVIVLAEAKRKRV